MRRERWKNWGLAALLAAGVLSGGVAASADDLEGAAVVLEKNLEKRTLLLDGGVLLYVDEKTRISGQDGQRIGLAEVPAAVREQPGMYSVAGTETVRWEARRDGTRNVATEIHVLGHTID